jgi:nitroreductase
MDHITFLNILPTITVLVGTSFESPQPTSDPIDLQLIKLPKPEKYGGKTILTALQERRTIRNISPEKLPLQVLSNLLWSASGINRGNAAFGKSGRTASSASNSQEIDLYIVMPEGVYLYDAVSHCLKPIAAGDFRARACRQVGAAIAPVNIFYVVDITRYDLGPEQPDQSIGDPEVQKSYYYTDVGFIAQNVYLFAASQGLAAWFHNCDKENTVREFRLRPEQRVLFAQSVGYPAKT